MTKRRKKTRPKHEPQFKSRGDSLLVRKAVKEGWDTPLENRERIAQEIIDMAIDGPSAKHRTSAFLTVLEMWMPLPND